MKKENRFSFQSRLKSIQYAFTGLLHFFKTEHNAWLHLIATIIVSIVALVVGVTQTEAMALIFAVALVWITEILNTCIEKGMDVFTDQYHPKIKFIKDLSAGAVLVSAVVALLIGLFVFIPKFIHL